MTLAVPQSRTSLWTGHVISCADGVAVVRIAGGDVRATYSGTMLGRLARDRGCAAQAGDHVVLRRWPDNKVTIEDVCLRAVPLAEVIELRRR